MSQAKKYLNGASRGDQNKAKDVDQMGMSFYCVPPLHAYHFIVYSGVKDLRIIISLVLTNLAMFRAVLPCYLDNRVSQPRG